MTPFYLAPMAELSHRALRELIGEFGGCDGYFSEMISASALLAGGPLEKYYIDNGPAAEKCVFQLVGSDIEAMAGAAGVLDRLECAGIDINMGCSAPLIRKTGAGAAWMMKTPDKAGELIAKIRPQVKRRLSVKLRLGCTEDFEYLVRFCRRLEDEGVELITLHPRLITEKFKRLARWDYVGKLRAELKIPVAGNGDVSSAEELVKRAEGPCDAVMVGRAAVKQPWIFQQAKENISRQDAKTAKNAKVLQESLRPLPFNYCDSSLCLSESSSPNLLEIGLRFIELLAKYQPVEFHVSRAKRFFGFFCENLKWGTFVHNRINRESALLGMEKVWLEAFREDA
ncbi:MAG: tRNA-dihydrouridine synthase family protein [Treponema sp.]|nr:tRNA-dihydrouridine synthase family protein [Treponema sp.]MCL2237310.1 tRNA-dihydrouridine synthase family protein [Treponema sp.]